MRAKKPTWAEKNAISWNGLTPKKWMVVKVEGKKTEIEHRETGRRKQVAYFS